MCRPVMNGRSLMTDEERIKLLEKATGPEGIRAAIAGLTPEELAEMGIV